MNPLRSAVNRTLLALIGAALLAGGVWLAATVSAVRGHLPGWWPTAEPGRVLLDRSALVDLRDHGWWAPLVIAGTACVLLLFLAWLLAQLRSGGRRLHLASPALTLRPPALADAVARRLQATPGVARAWVSLYVRPKNARARVRVELEPGTEPAAALALLDGAALDEAHRSLAPERIDLWVRVGVRSHHERRAL
ncbi:hypothetical protein [Streptomyces rochei]|uniref:Alkaline shock response membrane anchor protein AmaP n=1 Tax=Streptomyces rochei TaxID=1928 RepID=A0ABW7DYJ9_STRRO